MARARKTEPATHEERLVLFGEALRQAMAAAQVTQVELAQMVEKSSQASVSAWITGKSAPRRAEDVFAIEKALGTKPGALSKFLGYLPVEAVRSAAGFEDAVKDDPFLDADTRSFLLNAYRLALKDRGRLRARPRG